MDTDSGYQGQTGIDQSGAIMKTTTNRLKKTIAALACLGSLAGGAFAAPFSSGSTGADGAFAPAQNTALTLPPSGIFNFTTVHIPKDVTVSFKSNGSNTPVMILATGDVTIEGTIDIRGGNADAMREPIGSFLQQGGLGGVGGYSGGRGGDSGGNPGASGQGPGGGEGAGRGACPGDGSASLGGGGGGFAGVGGPSRCANSYPSYSQQVKGRGGPSYGSSVMLPLVGGSGGGGGGGAVYSTGIPGAGGGGGGGALMIAASGTVRLSGSILAQGGAGGGFGSNCLGWYGNVHGGAGGGGSGGIVRILAQAYQGGGTINVVGGVGGCLSSNTWRDSGSGSQGFVSVETPRAGTFSLNGLPSLAITQIGGQAVPPNPTGSGDISLPLTQANPVQVDIAASFIPPGTAVKVVLTPSYSGEVVTVNASSLAGTLESSTASASIAVPYGASTLLVQASYTLTLAMGEALSVYALGERVESVRMTSAPGEATQFKLVTVSGKEFDISPAVLAMKLPA